MPDFGSLEERVSDLELRWMRERDRADALSQQLYEHSQQLEKLTRLVEQLRAQQESGGPGLGEMPANDPPPHY